MAIENCHCGRPLHYLNEGSEKAMRKLVADRGRFIKITVEDRSFYVDRHYAALHGVQGKDLAILGFPEITSDAGNV